MTGVKRVEKVIQEKRVKPIYVEQVLSTGRWFNGLSSNDFLRLIKAIAGIKLEHAATVIDFLFMWLPNEQSIENELTKFIWQCLDADSTLDIDQYKYDQIACKLALSDIERGFTLLEKLLDKLLTLPCYIKCWNHINHYGQREFWEILYKADSKRAIQVALCSGVKEIPRTSRLEYHIHAVITQKNDLDLLIEFALENEKQAEFICSILSAVKPNFWSIAFKIVAKYPKNLEIRHILSNMALNNYWWENKLDVLSQKLKQLLDDDATPSTAFPWLEELNTKIEKESNFNNNNL